MKSWGKRKVKVQRGPNLPLYIANKYNFDLSEKLQISLGKTFGKSTQEGSKLGKAINTLMGYTCAIDLIIQVLLPVIKTEEGD